MSATSLSDGKSLVPADVVALVEQSERRDESREVKLREEVERTKRDADRLRQYIYSNANPNPMLVAISVIGIVVVVWLLWQLLGKPSIAGEWFDSNGRMWLISHNKLTGTVYIDDGEEIFDGKIQGNVFLCDGTVGLWDERDTILFTSGGTLTRSMT